MNELVGYKGASLNLLNKYNISIGDLITIVTSKTDYEGTLMPRYEYADNSHLVIKLLNGYNVGINLHSIKNITRISGGEKPHYTKTSSPSINQNLPKIAIISTGGTIASRVDYRTGGVHPALSASDLYSAVPELSQYANIDAEVISSIFSENITSKYWKLIALKVAEKVNSGSEGIVITHGTDTMGYTSAALSFALLGIPIPIVLVGSQRSSDRPSSDAPLNLLGSIILTSKASFSGVYVVMHSGMDDDVLSVHYGTKVRKNHTSRRDAFQSINIDPVAFIKGDKIELKRDNLPPRINSQDFVPKTNFEPKVALLKFHPDFDTSIIEYLINKDYRGIVLEGTGLGHIGNYCNCQVKNAIKNGILVAMTSQCIWGRVRMTVYDTGRDLLKMGVIPLDDMLPETAFVKMRWVLGNEDDFEKAKDLMRKNIAGEISYRSEIRMKHGF